MKEWIQSDMEETYLKERASNFMNRISKDREYFLGTLHGKADAIAGMDDHVAALRMLEELESTVKEQMKPGYRPEYTLRDRAEDLAMRGLATGLDFFFTRGYANAAVSGLQAAREDIRFGADDMTALKDCGKVLAIEGTIATAGNLAPRYGVRSSTAIGGTAGALYAADEFMRNYEETGDFWEASKAAGKKGATAGLQSWAMARGTEAVTEHCLGAYAPGKGMPVGPKGTRPGFSEVEPTNFKIGKGPSGKFPGPGPEELPHPKISKLDETQIKTPKPLDKDQFKAKLQDIKKQV